MPKLWEILKEKDKEIIKALMPPGWTPPREDKPATAKYPSIEEIDKTMRRPPRQKRGKGW